MLVPRMMVSAPLPPLTSSLPELPLRVSFPAPPSIVSLPPRPLRVSSPPSPYMSSLFSVPLLVSSPFVPTMVAAQATPLATTNAMAIAATNSKMRLISPTSVYEQGQGPHFYQLTLAPYSFRRQGYVRQSTKGAPNFRELRKGEVRRIPIPRTPVHNEPRRLGER